MSFDSLLELSSFPVPDLDRCILGTTGDDGKRGMERQARYWHAMTGQSMARGISRDP